MSVLEAFALFWKILFGIFICGVRTVYRSVRAGVAVSGHTYVEQPPEPGQPSVVHVWRCSTCEETNVTWAVCGWCSYRPKEEA